MRKLIVLSFISLDGVQDGRVGGIREEIGMGVLVGRGLRFDLANASWSFPTERFAWLENHPVTFSGADIQDGEMKTARVMDDVSQGDSPLESYLDQEMRFHHTTGRMAYGGQTPPWLEVAVGDEEIAAWREARADTYPRSRQYGKRHRQLATVLGYDCFDAQPIQLSM